MTRFIKHTILYLLLLLLSMTLILLLVSFHIENKGFKNHETEGNLLIMNEQENYDLLFMGISHARNFSRHKNHLKIEEILQKKIINIGQGYAKCGVNEQLFYLDYFYHKKNAATKLVYVISPPLFYSKSLPRASDTFEREPFEIDFFLRYLFFETDNKKERISTYLQSKFSRDWLYCKPKSQNGKMNKLDSLDTSAVNEGQKAAYEDVKSLERFDQSVERLTESIQLALENHSNVVLIIPPALFGKWKGHDKVANFALEMSQMDNVSYYDFSESILTPELYYDHHHLNTKGIIYFTEKYLKPIFD